MKALRFAEFGPPSILRIEGVAIPEPGEGEALVRVKAAAINPSVVVPAETLSLKPKPLSMAQAAAIGVPYITGWASIVSAAQVQPG
jgi:NADPH:quinone reductase-like Zn-dependent oxidoreductase